MAEQVWNRNLEQSKTGAYVVPMDDLRTIEIYKKIFISGEYAGSAQCPIASGKVAYLREMLITNLSGLYPVDLRWGDASVTLSGNPSASVARLVISSGQALGGTYKVNFDPGMGPYQSGWGVVSGGAQVAGEIVVTLQIDPQKEV